MGRKMKFLAVFRSRQPGWQHWRWVSCNNPRSLSFRLGEHTVKPLHSISFHPFSGELDPADSCPLTTSLPSVGYSSDSDHSDPKSLDVVVREARSARLFFEPNFTSSILEEAEKEKGEEKEEEGQPFNESLVIAMESENPHLDFLSSMEEMVKFKKMKEWDCLEELLSWYLRINEKENHGFIVGAFLDLLLQLSSSSSSSCSSSSSSPSSSSSSSSSSTNVHCSPDIVSFTSAETSFASSPSCSSVDEIDEKEEDAGLS